MENNKKPANFNWVDVRSACSIQKMFEELKLAVKQDAKAMNEFLKNDIPPRKFDIVEHSKFIKVFEVDRYLDQPPAIAFSLSDNVIQVSDDTNKKMFAVTIGLNDDGDCKFIVDEKERDPWQIRRQALEGLFFRVQSR